MKRNIEKRRSHGFRVSFTIALLAVAGFALLNSFGTQHAAPALNTDPVAKLYERSSPAFDLNLSRNLQNVRVATGEQLAAIDGLKAAAGAPAMTVRWNDFGGSPDVMYDFASRSYSGTPEEAARAFIADNPGLFDISDLNSIRLFEAKEALGGYMVRFNQTFNGIPVQHGGIGIVMNANKQVVMV